MFYVYLETPIDDTPWFEESVPVEKSIGTLSHIRRIHRQCALF